MTILYRRHLFFAVVLLVLVSCGAEDGATGGAANDSLALGATVYAENCASCHGANLEGEPNWQAGNPDGSFKAPPHDDDGHTWHHPDSYIYERIRFGTQSLDERTQALSNMPAYQDVLSEAEITAVVDFIKSHWSDRMREMQESRN